MLPNCGLVVDVGNRPFHGALLIPTFHGSAKEMDFRSVRTSVKVYSLDTIKNIAHTQASTGLHVSEIVK